MSRKTMNYKAIQIAFYAVYGRTVKSCWIAEVGRKHGKTTRIASNRKGKPQVECPADVFPKLEALMKEMGEI